MQKKQKKDDGGKKKIFFCHRFKPFPSDAVKGSEQDNKT